MDITELLEKIYRRCVGEAYNRAEHGLLAVKREPASGIVGDLNEFFSVPGVSSYVRRFPPGLEVPPVGGSYLGLRRLIFKCMPPRLRKGLTLDQVEVLFGSCSVGSTYLVPVKVRGARGREGVRWAEDPLAEWEERRATKHFPLLMGWRRVNGDVPSVEPVCRVYLCDLARMNKRDKPLWLRNWRGLREVAICPNCDDYFPKGVVGKFCSRECQVRAWNGARPRKRGGGEPEPRVVEPIRCLMTAAEREELRRLESQPAMSNSETARAAYLYLKVVQEEVWLRSKKTNRIKMDGRMS